jgi:hypothetical protein
MAESNELPDLDMLLEMHGGEETEWTRQAKTILISTPGHIRTYTEIQAELENAGLSVPPGIKMLAERELSAGGFFGDGRPLRFKRND